VQNIPGRSYGLEVSVRRDLTREIGGFLSYTLSRTERFYQNGIQPADTDRTHVLTTGLSLYLGDGWRAGARFSYETGNPYTPTLAYPGGELTLPQRRLPDFWNFDFQIRKLLWKGSHAEISAVLEWFNATMNTQPMDIQCFLYSAKCTIESIGPITIPSISVEGSL
jgi:hypothetical protein